MLTVLCRRLSVSLWRCSSVSFRLISRCLPRRCVKIFFSTVSSSFSLNFSLCLKIFFSTGFLFLVSFLALPQNAVRSAAGQYKMQTSDWVICPPGPAMLCVTLTARTTCSCSHSNFSLPCSSINIAERAKLRIPASVPFLCGKK